MKGHSSQPRSPLHTPHPLDRGFFVPAEFALPSCAPTIPLYDRWPRSSSHLATWASSQPRPHPLLGPFYCPSNAICFSTTEMLQNLCWPLIEFPTYSRSKGHVLQPRTLPGRGFFVSAESKLFGACADAPLDGVDRTRGGTIVGATLACHKHTSTTILCGARISGEERSRS
jgi:hypothetical protein